MCRHLVYVGTPIALGAVLTEPEHSLVAQARHARFQTSGTENPDGWGVGWYDDSGHPQRHRSATPMWRDDQLTELASSVRADTVVAAARLASPGAPIEESGNAPFVADGRWLFSLNGIIDGYREGIGDDLLALVSERRRAGIEGEADTETLFALVLDRLDAGRPMVEALIDVVATVEARTTGRLNMILSEWGGAAATAVGNSLFTNGPQLIASEPLDDDDDWHRVDDRSALTTDGSDLAVVAL
ncbi:MAG: class II glutamine amidotransferase [Acidimicrobiia bacterium]